MQRHDSASTNLVFIESPPILRDNWRVQGSVCLGSGAEQYGLLDEESRDDI